MDLIDWFVRLCERNASNNSIAAAPFMHEIVKSVAFWEGTSSRQPYLGLHLVHKRLAPADAPVSSLESGSPPSSRPAVPPWEGESWRAMCVAVLHVARAVDKRRIPPIRKPWLAPATPARSVAVLDREPPSPNVCKVLRSIAADIPSASSSSSESVSNAEMPRAPPSKSYLPGSATCEPCANAQRTKSARAYPTQLSAASSSWRFSTSIEEYRGRSSRNEHVCAHGRDRSGLPVVGAYLSRARHTWHGERVR